MHVAPKKEAYDPGAQLKHHAMQEHMYLLVYPWSFGLS
jgi:hypothetical protein